MGYKSQYEFSFVDRRPSPEEILEDERQHSEGLDYVISEKVGKWYDWIDDMKAISERWPGVMFVVTRRGEESEDVEVGYFLDGEHAGGKAEFKLPDPPEGWDGGDGARD